MTDDNGKGLYLIICNTPKGIAIRKNKVYDYGGAMQAIKKCPTNRDGVKWVMYEITELKRIGGTSMMNFWERKARYERGGCGQNPLPENPNPPHMKSFGSERPALETRNPPKSDGPKLIAGPGEYIFLDQNGSVLPLLFGKNVRIEHRYKEDKIDEVIISSVQENAMTYKERQKEIEIMMQSVTDGSYLVYDGFTTLYGKKLENYTQKEMYDTLKKLMGEKA